ncbi:hypothetical protein D3C74_118560 [compost metagenome]
MSADMLGLDARVRRMLTGASIQLDPLFAYYQDRSADSVAVELEAAGYRCVHYFVVREDRVNGRIVEALQRRGIAVWAMILGNGAFSTAHLPVGWKRWKMELVKEPNDSYCRLSPFAEEYVQWRKQEAALLVQRVPFDGFEIAEPYFPEWEGLTTGTYGDIGPHAAAAFQAQFGSLMPDFRDKRSSRYYKKVPELYRQWVELRVQAVNHMIDEVINGAGGVRQARPDIQIATWSLAVQGGRKGPALLREWQGLDAVSMIRQVKPDMHVLQTHWPDWMKARLPADYITKYQEFLDPIRSSYPGLPVGIQADIGSLPRMVRGAGWLRQFAAQVPAAGFDAWTAYEYHVGGYMYEQPPIPLSASRSAADELVVTFNKRIETNAALSAAWYTRRTSDFVVEELRIHTSETDGNRLYLRLERVPTEAFVMRLSGIQDTPQLWLQKRRRANPVPADAHVQVPCWI